MKTILKGIRRIYKLDVEAELFEMLQLPFNVLPAVKPKHLDR